MTLYRGPCRQWREGSRLLLPLVMVATGLGAGSVPAAGQHEQLVTERQADYESARRAHQSHQLAWNAQQVRWSEALLEVSAAKRSGNADRLDAADRVAIEQSYELSRIGKLVEGAAEVLEQRRQALQQALDLRMGALEDRLARAPTTAERNRTLDLIRTLIAQHEQIREERTNGLRASLVFWPGPEANPIEGPDDILARLQINERLLAENLEELARVDDEIGRVQRRLDLMRVTQDATASRTLFGSDPPVGPLPRDPAQAGAAAPGTPLTLDQQLVLLRVHQEQLETGVEQLRVRIENLRRRIGVAGVGEGHL